MRFIKFFTLAIAIAGVQAISADPAQAKNCGHEWAEPGTYVVSGNFRGKPEKAGAELTRDCRVVLKIPGVTTSTKAKLKGNCLLFSFKVDKQGVFKGSWCDDYAVVPWGGQSVRADVRKVGYK